MQATEPASTTIPVRACGGDCSRCPCLRLLAETEPHRETPIGRAPRLRRTISISRAARRRAAVRSTLSRASR